MAAPNGQVLSLVSILIDVTLSVSHLPPRGGDVLADTARTEVGGGLNVVTAAARQGVRVSYLGRHGAGRNGDLVRRALAAEGVQLALPPTETGDTGFCVGLAEPDLTTSYITLPGVEGDLTPAELEVPAITGSDYLVLSGYDLLYPVSGASITDWVVAGKVPAKLILDPGPLVARIPAERSFAILEHLDVLTLNEPEAQELSATPFTGVTLVNALRRELPLPAGALVVLRSGASGCYATGGALGDQILSFPVPRVEAVDTAGAGDTHTGVLVARLLLGDSVPDALVAANKAAAISVTRLGAATAPTAEEMA
ncbi:sugar/nucleoside kinase (ribokinase family) [Propionicimonas paludicola]|uniref:Sugar/nucleoside kinase (Ribokinase family) n=1 Tax=Propionicimonas paludicola TaxID=185243 RepID=A0A2A9CUQ2_9ACTN|nr:PfkB family carbohydrate kinase [Propionicimonas paludicola]PFG17861.1 sugar/nucleoside kinase (ribokinase family) [Propionicimonas paludicola]